MRCWASTTRQARRRSGRSSTLAAHRVQILGDMDEPGDGLQQRRGHALEVLVLGAQPAPVGLVVAAEQGVEAAVDPQELDRQLALLARGFEQARLAGARE